MFNVLRSKFGAVILGLVIGFIGFVFVFSGVFNPRSTRGMHTGAVAGSVNGEAITLTEFNRAFTQRVEMFKSFGGGKLTDEQIKMFRLKESVFKDLANRKLTEQFAAKSGMVASDEEVKDKIQEIPAFQKEGKFDAVQYHNVLKANNYVAGQFEDMMRKDISTAQWNDFLKNRAKISVAEVKSQYLSAHDRRNIKFVAITTEAIRKKVNITSDEAKKFLEDKAKANLVKAQFEQKKDTEFKGKAFDLVKEQIAKDLLAVDKKDQIKALTDEVAARVLADLGADDKADTKLNDYLKEYGLQVRVSGLQPRTNKSLNGVGESGEIFKDAFGAENAIAPVKGGKVKRYQIGLNTVIALVKEIEVADISKLTAEETEKEMKQLRSRKERNFFDSWMKQISHKASIDMNPSIVSDAEG